MVYYCGIRITRNIIDYKFPLGIPPHTFCHFKIKKKKDCWFKKYLHVTPLKSNFVSQRQQYLPAEQVLTSGIYLKN